MVKAFVGLVFAVTLFTTNAQAANWGSFQDDGCVCEGFRQYSAILWNIPWGASWEQACANQPATIDGQYFSSPTRCVNNGFNMWGQFEVADVSCSSTSADPRWWICSPAPSNPDCEICSSSQSCARRDSYVWCN